MHDARPFVPVVVPRLPLPVVGGAEKRTVRLLEALERAGGRPYLIVAEPAGDAGLKLVFARGWGCWAPLSSAPPGPGRRLAQHARRWPAPPVDEVAARVRALAGHAPFVQFEHTQSTCYRGAAGSRPCILSTHNVDSEMVRAIGESAGATPARLRAAWRWRAMRATERRAARTHEVVLCVSGADAGFYERLGAHATVVPNGVDAEFWSVAAREGSGEEILFFGNLAYAPNAVGLRRFLDEGWPALRRRRPTARLRIAGGGAPDGLRDAVAAADGAQLLGFVDDLLAELRRSSVVVVPLWHGAGTRLKVLEAMAAGRPVVGTALGVERTGFVDWVHGLVAPDGPGLAAATALLLDNPVRAAGMGRAARDHAWDMRWERVTAAAESAYAELLARAAR